MLGVDGELGLFVGGSQDKTVRLSQGLAACFNKGFKKMQASIHPEYKELKATCTCGAVYQTRSALAKETMHVEVCSACHPFYTGQQKIIDTAGRVEKFKSKFSMFSDDE